MPGKGESTALQTKLYSAIGKLKTRSDNNVLPPYNINNNFAGPFFVKCQHDF